MDWLLVRLSRSGVLMDLVQAGGCEELAGAFDLASVAPWAAALAPDVELYSAAQDADVPESAYSRTLTQEDGIGEGDLVATDGRWLYSFDRDGLVRTDLGDPDRQDRVALDYRPGALHLDGERLIVIGEDEEDVVVDVFRTSDLEALRQEATPGSLRETRLVGDRLVLVTRASVGGLMVGIDAATARQKGPGLPPGVGCTDVWITPDPQPAELTTVSTLDLSDPKGRIRGASVLAPAHFVYASEDAVWIGQREGSTTALHRFGLDRVALTDTVVVPGSVPTRYAVDEQDGVLRVASQDGTGSRVTTFDAHGDVIGQIVGLAPGEQLMTARFDRDRAYVVTYEVPRGDPLFVVGLSDPRAPTLIGELHVPGWSDLLLPIGGDRLLAVGMDVENGVSHAAVSLFDVGEGEPRLLDRQRLVARNTAARFDLHAWAWANGLLALPTARGIEVVRISDASVVPELVISTPKRSRVAERAVIVGDVVYGTSWKGRRTDVWSAASWRTRSQPRSKYRGCSFCSPQPPWELPRSPPPRAR
jgi:uncharacterized secreted protein with C-terminal beta-propeller domain